jgi:carboxyl-terminal processing protease
MARAVVTGISSLRVALLSWCIAAGVFSVSAGSAPYGADGAGPPASVEEPFHPASAFDRICDVIRKEFWDPNFNGVNWEELVTRYRAKVQTARDHEAFASLVNEMLGQLRTSHTCYLTESQPEYYSLQATLISQDLAAFCTSDTSVITKGAPGLYSSEGHPHRTGIGVVTKEIGGRHYVIRVLARTPAEKAHIMPGDWLVTVNGQPFHPVGSFQNKAEQEMEIVGQREPAESSRYTARVVPVDRNEKELFENDSFARTTIVEHGGHRLSYIQVWWLSGWVMRTVFDRGISRACEAEGVIFDLRDGLGGSPALAYIDPFLRGGLNSMSDETISRTGHVTGKVGYSGPVVVLVNGGTRSGKELLAYYFQKTKRGVLLGERTSGSVSVGTMKRITKESILYVCKAMIVVDGRRLEGVGVTPDILVPFDVRFSAGNDIQLQRAKDEIVKLIENSR